MRKVKLGGLLVCVIALLSACASTSKVKEVTPAAGNAIIYLTNHWISHVDDKRVPWKPGKQYEIIAGSRQLRYNYEVPSGVVYSRTEGFFEEGKSYASVAAEIYIDKSRKSILEIIEIVPPQSQITLPNKFFTSTHHISFNPDGSMIVIPNQKSLEIYNVQNSGLINTLTGHSKTVQRAQWSADGTKIVSSDDNGTIKVWDASSGKEIISIAGKKSAQSLYITPDGSKIICNHGNTLKVWDITNGRELLSIENLINKTGLSLMDRLGNFISGGIAISPDSQYFAAQFKEGTRVYPVNGGEPILIRGSPRVFKDNHTLLVDIEEEAVLIDIRSGAITNKNLPVLGTGAVFSADNTKIITRSYGIRIIDAETGNIIAKFTNPRADIQTFAVSPHNKIAAYSFWDRIIYFWDFESGEMPAMEPVITGADLIID